MAVWIDWALKKADWYDPTVVRKDEYFVRREHEKGADQKYYEKLVAISNN